MTQNSYKFSETDLRVVNTANSQQQAYKNNANKKQKDLNSNQFSQPYFEIIEDGVSQKQYKNESFSTQKFYTNTRITPSNHLQQYIDYFSEIENQADQHITFCLNNTQEKLKHKIVIINDGSYLKQLISFTTPTILISGILYGGIIVKYEIIIGKYKLKIDLLNITKKPPNGLLNIGIGGYGSIYRIRYSKSSNIVAKRILFKTNQVIEFQQQSIVPNRIEINESLHEYSIYKICSFYKIGPQIANELGFDIVCFCNCLQFYMEECYKGRYYFDGIEKDLKLCLRILHKIKIIHKDVKPANILFSCQHNRNVLGDFGISHSIQENLGYKTKTYKQGSPGFMSPQMDELREGKQKKYIDLYYNDLFGLKTTLIDFKYHYQIRTKNKIIFTEQKCGLLEILNYIDKQIYKSIYLLKVYLNVKSKEIQICKQDEQQFLEQIHFMLKQIFQIYVSKEENLTIQALVSKIQKKDYECCISNLIRCYGLTTQLIYELNKMNSFSMRIQKLKKKIAIQKSINYISQQKIKKWQKFQFYNKYLFSLQRQLIYYKTLQKQLNTSYHQIIFKILLQIFFEKMKRSFDYTIFKRLDSEILSIIAQKKMPRNEELQLFFLVRQGILFSDSSVFRNSLKQWSIKYPKLPQKVYSYLITYHINSNQFNDQFYIIKYCKKLELIYNQNSQMYMTQYLQLLCQLAVAYQISNTTSSLYYFEQLKVQTEKYINARKQINIQIINCYQYLGLCYQTNQLYQLAIKCYEKQIFTIKYFYGDYQIKLAKCYIHMAKCFLRMMKLEQAKQNGKKALQIIKFYNYYKEFSRIENQCYILMCAISLVEQNQQMVMTFYNQLMLVKNNKRLEKLKSENVNLFESLLKYEDIVKEYNKLQSKVIFKKNQLVQQQSKYIMNKLELNFKITFQAYFFERQNMNKILKEINWIEIRSNFFTQKLNKLKQEQLYFSQKIESDLRQNLKKIKNQSFNNARILIILTNFFCFNDKLPIKNIKFINQAYTYLSESYFKINWIQKAIINSKKRTQLIIHNLQQFDKFQLIKCLLKIKSYFIAIYLYSEAIYYFNQIMSRNKNLSLKFIYQILSELYSYSNLANHKTKAYHTKLKYYKNKTQLKNQKYSQLYQMSEHIKKKKLLHMIKQYWIQFKLCNQMNQNKLGQINSDERCAQKFQQISYYKKYKYLKRKGNIFKLMNNDRLNQLINEAIIQLTYF